MRERIFALSSSIAASPSIHPGRKTGKVERVAPPFRRAEQAAVDRLEFLEAPAPSRAPSRRGPAAGPHGSWVSRKQIDRRLLGISSMRTPSAPGVINTRRPTELLDLTPACQPQVPIAEIGSAMVRRAAAPARRLHWSQRFPSCHVVVGELQAQAGGVKPSRVPVALQRLEVLPRLEVGSK